MVDTPVMTDDPPVEADIDYLPARDINEYVYCPRLFYLMHVEGQFADSVDTLDGQWIHRRVDAGTGHLEPAVEPLASGTQAGLSDHLIGNIPDGAIDETSCEMFAEPASTRSTKKKRQLEQHDALPSLFDGLDGASESVTPPNDPSTEIVKTSERSNAPDDALDSKQAQKIHRRSVTLSSDSLGVIAKLDLVEADGETATPIDYKRGRPKRMPDGTAGAWDPERVQIALQALVLRENGYRCDRGWLYFNETRQRVEVQITDKLIELTQRSIRSAQQVRDERTIPPPLVNSPKCARCSLVKICLPDETRRLVDAATDQPAVVRPLFTARDERRPIYFNTQGLWIGKTGELVQAKLDGKVIQEIRLQETNQVNLFGNIQLSTQAIQTMANLSIPVGYFSQKGYFYAITHALGVKNILVRREQFRKADDPAFCLSIAQQWIQGKIRNQRTLLMRNQREPTAVALRELKRLSARTRKVESLASLLGIEGTAARIYFQNFAGMIKVNCDLPPSGGAAIGETRPAFNFRGRNRRPPRDPVNALLSLAYSLLTKDCVIAATMVGLDPYLGFYHQIKPGKPALALDLMETFRPLIADSAVLTAINNRMVTPDHFIRAGKSVVLTDTGRKHFLLAYEQRMNHLVTHPLFEYRVSYRRLLEIQTRLLARLLTGEINEHPVFVTR